MNNVQRQRLMSNLPKDQELQDILHAPTDTDKTVHDQINRWLRKKIFFLVITVLFYAIYYYAKNKEQESRNIFKAISQTRKPLKYLKAEINTKNKKEEKTTAPENDESTDENYSENAASYDSPTATSSALRSKHPKKIKFEKNILQCHRLQDGNFLIQLHNYDIQIIDRYGKKIKTLATDNKLALTAISQLADSTLIFVGKTLNSNIPTLYLWNDHVTVEAPLESIDNIVSLDTHGNTIAILANAKDTTYTYILEVSDNQFKQLGGQIPSGKTPQKIMLINDDEIVISHEKDEKNPHLLAGLLKFNFRTNHQIQMPCNVYHLSCLSNKQLLSIDNPSKVHIQVHNQANLNLLFDADIKEHRSGISQIASSANGKFFATSDWDGLIILWDSESFAILKSFDTSIFEIAYLSVSDQGEISAAEGELENFSPETACNGQTTISSIHFYNRPVKQLFSPREEKDKDKIYDDISESPVVSI